jgi:hypothetical protein
MAVMTPIILRTIISSLTGLVFLLGAPVQAAASKTSSKINVASAQIALGHKLIGAICLAETGITPNIQKTEIKHIRDSIDTTLNAMINGDEILGIAAEADSTTQTHLSSIQKVWKPLRTKVDFYLSGEPHTVKQVTKLSFKADSLQKLWANIISRYELKSSVNEGQHSLNSSRQFKVAGNQDTLIQKSSKLACLIHLNGGPDAAKHQLAQLQETLPALETSTFGLAFSDPKLQLVEPPTDDIQSINFNNWQDWVAASYLFEEVLAGTMDEEELRDLANNANFLSQSYQSAMDLYTKL